jgi:hypothetical protein
MAMWPLLRLFELLKARGLLASLTSGMATREEESSPSKRFRGLLESLRKRGPRFVFQCRTDWRVGCVNSNEVLPVLGQQTQSTNQRV